MVTVLESSLLPRLLGRRWPPTFDLASVANVARVLLCYLVLNEVRARENAWSLAPDKMNIRVIGGLSETVDTITGLKAVHLKGFPKQQSASWQDKEHSLKATSKGLFPVFCMRIEFDSSSFFVAWLKLN